MEGSTPGSLRNRSLCKDRNQKGGLENLKLEEEARERSPVPGELGAPPQREQ